MPRETSRSNAANELRENLRIDEDDIDHCLVAQPEYYYMAAEAVALATSRRDTLKLQRDETIAELDQAIRRKALEDDRKITEGQISNELKTLPKVKEINRQYVEACKVVDEAVAMKESYHQRSYMLRELNASANAKLYNLGLERGAGGGAGRRMVERGRAEIERKREDSGVFDRRVGGNGGGVARHRPRDQDD